MGRRFTKREVSNLLGQARLNAGYNWLIAPLADAARQLRKDLAQSEVIIASLTSVQHSQAEVIRRLQRDLAEAQAAGKGGG
jgi:hypothetical protein